MKHTLLVIAFLVGNITGFAQTETTVWNGKTYYVYPHQLDMIDVTESFSNYADSIEVLKRDDNNQKVVEVRVRKLIENENYRRYDRGRLTRKQKEEDKLMNELLSKKPEYYYYYADQTEGDITPALTPIPDGDYVQYYRDVPYLDKTVLRYRNDVVAGVFHIKNNQLDGEATWYTSNGMVLKKGTFSAGARQGNWFFNSYTIAYNVYYMGKDPLESIRLIIANELEYDTVTENITYHNGLRNGPYSYYRNSMVEITGFFKNDQETGTWDIYGYTFEYVDHFEGSEIVHSENEFFRKPFVQKHYTLPSNSKRGKGIILRDEVVANEFSNPDSEDDYWSEHLFDTSLDLYLPDYFEDFSTFYTILSEESSEESIELPEEEVNSYEGEETDESYSQYGMLDEYYTLNDFLDTNDYSQTGGQYVGNKYYTRNQLIDSVGYLFHYDGIYEERYGNGQLKFRFEIKDGNLVSEDTVFWENGLPANTIVFDEKNHRYEQHFFDYWGKLYKTNLYDEKGETIHQPQKNTKEVEEIVQEAPTIIDGLVYSFSDDRSPLYYSDREKLAEIPLTERTLIEASRWVHDSSFCVTSYLDPESRTLEYTESNILGNTVKKQRAQFGEDYETVNATTEYLFGKLRLETISNGSLIKYDYSWYNEYQTKALPQVNALYWEGNYEQQEDAILYYGEQPFSGSFSIALDNKKYSFSATESKLNIRLMDNNREYIQMAKDFDRFTKKGKKTALLELYTPQNHFGESVFANFLPHCRRFISFGDYYSFFGEYDERSYYGEEKPVDEMLYSGSITGTYLNGKPEGEWLVKNTSGEIATRMTYEKGELEGELVYYATKLPLTKEQESYYYYQSSADGTKESFPTKKVRYVAQKESYHNGLLEGPFTITDWKGNILSYDEYHEGLRNGVSYQRNDRFYTESRYEMGLVDGIARTYVTLPKRDSILLFELNFQDGALQGESRTYHTNGKLAKRGFFLAGQPIDDYEAYDTLGFKYQYVKFQYNQPVEEKIWEENQLSARYLFDWKDSIAFDITDITESSSFEKLASSLGFWSDSYEEPYYGRPSLVDKTGIDYSITKYYPNDSVARFGSISKGKKVGYWKYFSYEGKALYEINYVDTLLVINDSVRFKSKGILTYLGENNRPLSRSYIIEKVEKYDCSHTDHTEERMLYTFWEVDTAQHRINGYVKNYYDNGAIQNEGFVVNGLATGTWKLYDSDGQLSQVGNYKLGKRDGRWLKGDLSNVKNMSEICLNPNLENLDEIIAYQEKLLDISVIYYGMGKILKSEYYGINMNPEDDPNGYNYYDSEGN